MISIIPNHVHELAREVKRGYTLACTMGISGKKIAIDIGTECTRIYVPRKGVVVNEPTAIAFDESSVKKKIVAVGRLAKEMAGKTPEAVNIIHPMKNGVIADYAATSNVLSRFIHMAIGRIHLTKPTAMVTVSSTATSTEKKAIIDAGIDAGLQQVFLIDSGVAAALGSGMAMSEPVGNMVLDIGAGTTEAAIFSLGGIVSEGSVRVAGKEIDDAIRLYGRRELGVNLSKLDVEEIKKKFLNLSAKENNSLAVMGQSIVNGLPKKVTFKQHQLLAYVEMPLEKIVKSVRGAVEKAPPDVIGDIIKNGLIVSGGGAQLRGVANYMTKQLNIACAVAENPELVAIKGAYAALNHLEEYKKSLLA